MSSRNVYLGPEERRAATALYRALQAARQRHTLGERSAESPCSTMRAILDAEPLAQTDYISIADQLSAARA